MWTHDTLASPGWLLRWARFLSLELPPLIQHGDAPGFPSKHASVAMAFAFAMMRGEFPRSVAWAILALSVAIGWGRVYLGVHLPSDVLAGVLVGAVSA